MRNRRKMRSQMDAIDQINVTPLLDLTFLLLIVFMITMPLMEYGTSIKPPEMNAEKLPDDNFKSVTLTSKGTIMFGDSVVTQEELIEHLRQLDSPHRAPVHPENICRRFPPGGSGRFLCRCRCFMCC